MTAAVRKELLIYIQTGNEQEDICGKHSQISSSLYEKYKNVIFHRVDDRKIKK